MENKNIIKILLDITRTLARQDIAFRGDGKLEVNGNFNQIVMLLSRHCLPLKRWLENRNGRAHSVTYMSNVSQNEMIDLLDEVDDKVIHQWDPVTIAAAASPVSMSHACLTHKIYMDYA